MKQRKLADVMSAPELKLAEIKEKKQQAEVAKKVVSVEDLMKSIIYAVTSLKQAVESSNNIPDETLKMVSDLISSMEKKSLNVPSVKNKTLKSVVPVRNKNGVAIRYDFEWINIMREIE